MNTANDMRGVIADAEEERPGFVVIRVEILARNHHKGPADWSVDDQWRFALANHSIRWIDQVMTSTKSYLAMLGGST